MVCTTYKKLTLPGLILDTNQYRWWAMSHHHIMRIERKEIMHAFLQTKLNSGNLLISGQANCEDMVRC